jgi:hypothetical protein
MSTYLITDSPTARHYRGWAFPYNISDVLTADGCPVQQPWPITAASGGSLCCVYPTEPGAQTCKTGPVPPACCASASGCGSTPRCGGARDESDCHFSNTATDEYDKRPGIKWVSCTAK